MAEESDVYTYRRSKAKTGARKKGKTRYKQGGRGRVAAVAGLRGTILLIALYLLAFFLGRSVLLGELMPFGPALLAAVIRVYRRAAFGVALAVMAGIVTMASSSSLPGALLSILLILILFNFLPLEVKKPWLVVPGLTAAIIIIVKTSFLAFTMPSTYGYVTIFFEAVFAGVLAQIFIQALSLLINNSGLRPLTIEELFCLLILFFGLIAGSGGYQWWLISLRGVLSRFFILTGAYLGGPGMGAAIGALVGIVPGLAFESAPVLVNTYAFAGLVSGICQGFGKLGVAFGFILANVVLSVYSSNYASFTSVLAETGLAVLIYFLIPESLVDNFKILMPGVLSSPVTYETGDDSSRRFAAARVRGWAAVMGELALAFEEISSTSSDRQVEGKLGDIINHVVKKVCVGCSFYQSCWDKEFYRTYQGLLNLFTGDGGGAGEDMLETLKRRCSRFKQIELVVACLYETCGLEHYWYRRVHEERNIISLQIKGLAGMMEMLAGEMEKKINFIPPVLPGDLKEKLEEKGIDLVSVTADYRSEGWLELTVARPACDGRINCQPKVAQYLGEYLNLSLHPGSTDCLYREDVAEKTCKFRLYPDLGFQLSFGVAQRSKVEGDIIGDNYAIVPLPDGKMAIILSDGMGTGLAAAMESNVAINLLTELLRAGFGEELAVRMVNSSLVLNEQGENFTTIDLAVIDLYAPSAGFLKVGGEPGFLVRGNRVGLIKQSSLPAGIIKEIDVCVLSRNLMPGDCLIMVTDGVLNSFQGENKEMWLTGIIQKAGDMEAQDLADLILNLADAREPEFSDDKTVIVARLKKVP